MKKIIILGIICLFVGIGFQPAFANDIQLKEVSTSLEESHEEIIISFYGIGKTDDIKVLLTEEQADKLDMILNELDFKIRNSESKSQTIDSINWAFDSFQEFNLFNKQDEKIIKTLLISLFTNPKVKSDIKPINQEIDENFNCTITGYLYQKTFRNQGIVQFYGGAPPIIDQIYDFIDNHPIIGVLIVWPIVFIPITLYLILTRYKGKMYDADVSIGLYFKAEHEAGYTIHEWRPIECDIQTNGDNGVVTWEGAQYGHIGNFMTHGRDKLAEWWWWTFIGIVGFTGLRIYKPQEGTIYISGFAEHVALDPSHPPF